jgi:hypothetical protein
MSVRAGQGGARVGKEGGSRGLGLRYRVQFQASGFSFPFLTFADKSIANTATHIARLIAFKCRYSQDALFMDVP